MCPECQAKSYDRIEAAITHNRDKEADWWVSWWDKEIQRQETAMKTHCEKP